MAAVPKLDKDHGFLKFVVQNQIDRDNYEQEQKALKFFKSHSLKKEKQYREEIQQYAPPKRRNKAGFAAGFRPDHLRSSLDEDGDENKINKVKDVDKEDKYHSSGESFECHKILFQMEYIPKCGETISVTVFKTSKAKQIMEEIASRCHVREDMKQALHRRIQTEIDNSER